VPDETGALDCDIASEIAQRFNLKHEIIRYQQATEQQLKDWLDRTGHCIGGRIHRSFAMLCQLNSKYPLISGIAGAIGRAHYYNKLDATPNTELTGEKITRLLRLPQTPEIVNRADKWLQGLSDYDPLTILDLLYIEQRSGCWGALSIYGNNWNVFEVYPFCHRRIFELILSLPYEYRIKGKLNLDLIKTQWPELLKFPINNYRGIRGLRRSFRGLRKDIRRLEVVKSVRKVLRNMKE
jgi:hypothetical protein